MKAVLEYAAMRQSILDSQIKNCIDLVSFEFEGKGL